MPITIPITLSDETLDALRAALGVTPGKPEPTTPDLPLGDLILPVGANFRARMTTDIGWGGTAVAWHASPSPLGPGNVWQVRLKVEDGERPTLRFRASEYGGAPTPRYFAMIRDRDNVILLGNLGDAAQGQTISALLSVGRDEKYMTRVEVGERYTFVIWNKSRSVESTMAASMIATA